ncbi:MAG: type 1 glutamine amidotransferase, partial [Thermoleophilia bacterium]
GAAPPPPPRIVVLQHHERVPLGALAPVLSREAELTLIRGYHEPEIARESVSALVSSGDYDGVVALGGPMGVCDIDSFPVLRNSLRLLEDALRREAPILGLCLGSQLLGHALGSRVFPGSERGLPPEVGFFPVRLTETGREDPVASLYDDAAPVLFWHRNTNDLPTGAALLAISDRYPLAAFRWGRWAYGLQFHLEITMEWLPRWIEQSPLPGETDADTHELMRLGSEFADTNAQRAASLARLFAGYARTFRGGTETES